MERTAALAKKSYSSYTNDKDVENTRYALRLQDVRKAILTAFDYPTYYARMADGDSTSVFARQNVVHTYVPKNFVYDNNGNEYTQTYYAGALAEHDGITLEAAQARLETGQFDTRQATDEQVAEAVAKALKAVEDYNNSSLATAAAPVTANLCLSFAGTITSSISLRKAFPAAFTFIWSCWLPLSIVKVNDLSVVNL